MTDTTLLHLFTDDIGTARQLLELIDAEHQALNERDLTRLQDILTQKLPLLSLLDQHGSERANTLIAQQLSPDREGLQALAAQSTDGASLLARSEELGDLLAQCREANLRNGRIIRSSQASLASAMNILRGGDATPGLYDSRGSTAKIGQQRPLSQA